jgi:hypothetical protein
MLPESVRPSPMSLHGLVGLLSDLCRREILLALARRPRIVKILAADLQIDHTLISKNLQFLSRAGLVAFKQTGHGRLYRTGPSVQVVFKDGGMRVAVYAACGSMMILELTPAQTALHDWDAAAGPGPAGPKPARPEASTGSSVLSPEPPEIKVPRAAKPARRQSAPRDSRPPSAPG